MMMPQGGKWKSDLRKILRIERDYQIRRLAVSQCEAWLKTQHTEMYCSGLLVKEQKLRFILEAHSGVNAK